MSLVGTRPPTVDEWEQYEPHHRARMAFRPGLTGLWQVSGRSNITDFEEVVKLDTTSFSCACVSISDKYGEYGIVGFYALKNDKLEHFVFSCRTIGFGVENYLYKKLGYPDISVIGDVSTELSKEYAERIDWIKESSDKLDEVSINKNKPSFLMIAGCDLDQACAYIESEYEIRKEFTTVIDGREIRTSDTSQILNAIDLSTEEKNELCKNLPFFEKGISFNSEIFSGRFKTIVIQEVICLRKE